MRLLVLKSTFPDGISHGNSQCNSLVGLNEIYVFCAEQLFLLYVNRKEKKSGLRAMIFNTSPCTLSLVINFAERDLVLELDRAKYSQRNGVVKKKTKGPTHVEKLIKGLEDERNYWKGEVETLQKLLQTSRSRASSRSRPTSRSPTRTSRSTPSTPSKSPTRARSRNASPYGTPAKNNTKVKFQFNLCTIK